MRTLLRFLLLVGLGSVGNTAGFGAAPAGVRSVAEIAEEDNHHPDLDVRFNKVRVLLSTRSEGGVTELDFDLAEKIDTLVEG